MSFLAKTDYFGLADGSIIQVSDSADGRSVQNVTALKEDGSVGANEVFGEQLSPSNTYKIAGAATADIVLGSVLSADGFNVMLGQVQINTSAGGEPTMQASGESVEDDAASHSCTYTVSMSGLTQKRHAQILFNAFTLAGAGCFLTDANYTVQANIGKATVNGEPVASDVTEGMIEAQITVTQTDATAPTLTAGEGWQVTSTLAQTNPDGNYPTYSATLTKYLQKDS